MKTCLLCVYGIKHNMNRRKSVANQENFVAQEDFFFNSFCWCYMKIVCIQSNPDTGWLGIYLIKKMKSFTQSLALQNFKYLVGKLMLLKRYTTLYGKAYQDI